MLLLLLNCLVCTSVSCSTLGSKSTEVVLLDDTNRVVAVSTIANSEIEAIDSILHDKKTIIEPPESREALITHFNTVDNCITELANSKDSSKYIEKDVVTKPSLVSSLLINLLIVILIFVLTVPNIKIIISKFYKKLFNH